MVKADSLRFTEEPETEVRFTGGRGRQSISGSVRTNLPQPVDVGVEYRDARVDYTLATRVADAPAPNDSPDSDDAPDGAGAAAEGRRSGGDGQVRGRRRE